MSRFSLALPFCIVSLSLLSCTKSFAQDTYTIHYDVTPDTAGHYLNVEMTYTPGGAATPDGILLKMPVWAPGYYLIMDYPKYLTDFHAEDKQGNAVAWRKEGKNGWHVLQPGGALKIRYRIFANARSVAECRVENDIAFIAPNGVFMYVKGGENHRVDVTYHLPQNWQHISTGLKRSGQATRETGKHTFTAPNFDVLYDSPVLMGNHYVKTFTHEGRAYEFALETPEGYDNTPFENDFKKMVSATTSLMGDVPYENYCLIHLGQGQGGLEHLNSQACYTEGTWNFPSREDYLRHLSFTTHEYFHLYNVKCIRPIELGPFDYDREVFTPMLWVSEGFTVYYESRNLLRAGIVDGDYVLASLSEFFRTIEGNEGHRHMSLRQSSYDIWLNFFNRAANGRDVRISYYDKGPIIGLLFDIDIRRKTGNRHSLDDLMRLLYNRYYKQLGRGFTEEEFWRSAAEVAGQELTLMRRYVDTTDDIDYEDILKDAGLAIDRSTWTLHRMSSPSRQALRILKSMGLEEAAK